MTISGIPFSIFTWEHQTEVVVKGASGETRSRTVSLGEYGARFVTFGADYKANCWCAKGHIVFILEGELNLSLENGRETLIAAGEGFVLSDDDGRHLVLTIIGATAIILD